MGDVVALVPAADGDGNVNGDGDGGRELLTTTLTFTTTTSLGYDFLDHDVSFLRPLPRRFVYFCRVCCGWDSILTRQIAQVILNIIVHVLHPIRTPHPSRYFARDGVQSSLARFHQFTIPSCSLSSSETDVQFIQPIPRFLFTSNVSATVFTARWSARSYIVCGATAEELRQRS